ncbi:hypothetical protein FB446DRAFT_721939 [Lentinula raphanica]|nr:hypothetical protein FB446DRAFT_721939 [Lentinula raphanica]
MRFITTLLPFITLVVRVAATDIPLDNLPVPPLAAHGSGSENHRAEIQPYGHPTTPPSAYLPAHRVHDVDPAHGNPSSVIHLPYPPDGTYLEPPPTYAQAVALSLPPDGGAFVPSTPQLERGYHLGLRMSQEQAQATGASRVAVVLVSRFPQLERYMDNLPYKLGIGCIVGCVVFIVIYTAVQCHGGKCKRRNLDVSEDSPSLEMAAQCERPTVHEGYRHVQRNAARMSYRHRPQLE